MAASIKDFIKEKLNCRCEVLGSELSAEESEKSILKHFGAASLSGIGMQEKIAAVCSLGNLFEYLKSMQKDDLNQIRRLQVYSQSEYMGLDINSVRNLEIVETMRTKSKKGSLLWVLDKTKTAMGKRMLRSWVERPLLNPIKIKERHEAVEELVGNTILRESEIIFTAGILDPVFRTIKKQ